MSDKADKKPAEKDASALEKRRRQNRESQRRYRERHRPKTTKANHIYDALQAHLSFSAPPHWPPTTSPLLLAPGSYTSSPAYNVPVDPCLDPSLLPPGAGAPVHTSEWSSDLLFPPSTFEPQGAFGTSVSGQSLPSPALTALSSVATARQSQQPHSSFSTPRSSSHLQRRPSDPSSLDHRGTSPQAESHGDKSPLPSYLVPDTHSEGSPAWSSAEETQYMPTPDSTARLSPKRQLSPSNGNGWMHNGTEAEKMIQDVQDLYGFGVSAGFLRKDSAFHEGLEGMKQRFRAVSMSFDGNPVAAEIVIRGSTPPGEVESGEI